MATHSSTLAWKMPWTEVPGRLQSMGLLRVGHDWVTSLSLFTFMHWRRKWQPTPVFLPGEPQEWGGLVGCCLWGRTELDTTERLNWTDIHKSWGHFHYLCSRFSFSFWNMFIKYNFKVEILFFRVISKPFKFSKALYIYFPSYFCFGHRTTDWFKIGKGVCY